MAHDLTTEASREPLDVGATIGILGGGQLGRMLCLAAARLGLKTHVYSNDPDSPAFEVTSRATHGTFTDLPHLESFASQVDVVTYEFENVPVDAAQHLLNLVPVRPGPRALEVAQDRLTEKQFISALGIGTARFADIKDARDLARALQQFAGPSILKTRRLGYDGKGQISLSPGADGAVAMAAIGQRPAILERRVAFTKELSVLIVRGRDGEKAFYDCAENTHENGILRKSVVPARLSPATVAEARAIAGTIAEALDYCGVLAVELFHGAIEGDPSGAPTLLVNEIAPRVHNSGHWSLDACPCSQFENHIRAVAGWPLGSSQRHADAEMVNIIGGEIENWRAFVGQPDLCVHLYGKHEARRGRKMGHLTRLKPLA